MSLSLQSKTGGGLSQIYQIIDFNYQEPKRVNYVSQNASDSIKDIISESSRGFDQVNRMELGACWICLECNTSQLAFNQEISRLETIIGFEIGKLTSFKHFHTPEKHISWIILLFQLYQPRSIESKRSINASIATFILLADIMRVSEQHLTRIIPILSNPLLSHRICTPRLSPQQLITSFAIHHPCPLSACTILFRICPSRSE